MWETKFAKKDLSSTGAKGRVKKGKKRNPLVKKEQVVQMLPLPRRRGPSTN